MQPRAAQPYYKSDYLDAPHPRQSFQYARTSVGAGSAGDWIKMAGILSLLIIGELVNGADKRKRSGHENLGPTWVQMLTNTV